MSTNDPIEDMFRDNRHGLDEEPRDLIWDRIEERLDEKSVQKKKVQWWKYATAASLIMGTMIGIWALLNNPKPVSQMESAPMVYETPEEINEENASEILNKLEENNPSVVIREEKKSAPEIIESELENKPQQIELKLPEPMKSEAVYDIAPMEGVSAAPVMARAKISEESEEIAISTKKESKAILQNPSQTELSEREDKRRLGNSYFVPEKDSLSSKFNFFDVLLKNKTIRYDLVSKSDSIYIFENAEIAYPKQIIFQKMKDSISIIYTGKNSKRNSKESKEIREFIEENKQGVQSQFWDN